MMYNVLFNFPILISSILSKAWFGQIFTYIQPFFFTVSLCINCQYLEAPPLSVAIHWPCQPGNQVDGLHSPFHHCPPFPIPQAYLQLSNRPPAVVSQSSLFPGDHTNLDFFPPVGPLNLPTPPHPIQIPSCQLKIPRNTFYQCLPLTTPGRDSKALLTRKPTTTTFLRFRETNRNQGMENLANKDGPNINTQNYNHPKLRRMHRHQHKDTISNSQDKICLQQSSATLSQQA